MSLTLNTLSPSDIPHEAADPSAYSAFVASLTKASGDLINSLGDHSTWRPKKTYTHDGTTTETLSSDPKKPPPGAGETGSYAWHARKSLHPVTETSESGGGVSYDAFKRGLYERHSEQEKEYIDALVVADLVDRVSKEEGRAEVWNLKYKLPIMTSNRDFLSLVMTVDDTATEAGEGEGVSKRRQFRVISVPVKDEDKAPSGKNGYTRGKYVSVEQVTETSNGIEWLMATASDPGGSIPRSFSEMAMLVPLFPQFDPALTSGSQRKRPGKIAEDVPSFINWIRKKQ